MVGPGSSTGGTRCRQGHLVGQCNFTLCFRANIQHYRGQVLLRQARSPSSTPAFCPPIIVHRRRASNFDSVGAGHRLHCYMTLTQTAGSMPR